MPIDTLASYLLKCEQTQGGGIINGSMGNGSHPGGGDSMFPASGFARMQLHPAGSGVTPIVSGACYANTDGCVLKGLPATSSKRLFLAEIEWGFARGTTTTPRNFMMLIDRLVHTNGLLATVTTEQLTNFPTAPLPRYADGEGVQMMLEFYATATTVNGTAIVKYTNSKGVAGKLSQPIVMQGNTQLTNCLFVGLADGDTGVQSVESVTFTGTATTGGEFGVTLFKQLAFSPMDNTAQVERHSYRNLLAAGALVEIMPNACLSLLLFGMHVSASSCSFTGRIGVVTE